MPDPSGPSSASAADLRRTNVVGRRYGPTEYEVGREKIREFATVLGEDNVIYHDRAAARAAGFRDVVAPPMFCVVYSVVPVISAIADVIGAAIPRMLHGSQEFTWDEVVCSGDLLHTTAEVADVHDDGDKTFVVLLGESTNQDGRVVLRSRWTEIIRGGL